MVNIAVYFGAKRKIAKKELKVIINYKMIKLNKNYNKSI